MRDPKILLGRLWVIFDATCFFLALSMAIELIGRFRKDTSATTIAYKKYAASPKDKYPTFSLCITGDALYRYDNMAILKAYKIDPAEYQMLLEGKPAFLFKYNAVLRLYEKTPLSSKYETNYTFDEMAKNYYELSDIITEAIFETEEEGNSIYYGKEERVAHEKFVEKPPFYLSYRTSKMLCYTRESKLVKRYDSGSIRRKDYFYLDLSFLGPTTEIDIFIHYPGQLMRYLENPSLALASHEMKRGKYEIKISQSTLLKKRSTKSAPCVKNGDYDLYLQEGIVNKIDCIPPFWIYPRKDLTHVQECTSLDKLKAIHNLTMDIYKNKFVDIQPPCLDMFNSIVWNRLKSRRHEDSAEIEISYLEKYYEEISQVVEFGFLDFVSSLGGFIGIFLGYSMMQIPELLGTLPNLADQALTRMISNDKIKFSSRLFFSICTFCVLGIAYDKTTTLLDYLIIDWMKYFRDIKADNDRKCNSIEETKVAGDELLDATGNNACKKSDSIGLDIKSQTTQNFFKIGSKKYPLYANNEMDTSTVKDEPKYVSVGSLMVMIEGLAKAIETQNNEMNEKIANLDTNFVSMRSDMENLIKGVNNDETRNEVHVNQRGITNIFRRV